MSGGGLEPDLNNSLRRCARCVWSCLIHKRLPYPAAAIRFWEFFGLRRLRLVPTASRVFQLVRSPGSCSFVTSASSVASEHSNNALVVYSHHRPGISHRTNDSYGRQFDVAHLQGTFLGRLVLQCAPLNNLEAGRKSDAPDKCAQ